MLISITDCGKCQSLITNTKTRKTIYCLNNKVSFSFFRQTWWYYWLTGNGNKLIWLMFFFSNLLYIWNLFCRKEVYHKHNATLLEARYDWHKIFKYSFTRLLMKKSLKYLQANVFWYWKMQGRVDSAETVFIFRSIFR